MNSVEIFGAVVGSIAVYIFVGIITTAVYSFGAVKLKRKLPDETGMAFLVVGWPITFFVAIGLALRYAGERMRDQAKLQAANEGQVPSVRGDKS